MIMLTISGWGWVWLVVAFVVGAWLGAFVMAALSMAGSADERMARRIAAEQMLEQHRRDMGAGS